MNCEICCRFSDKFSTWAPFILKEEIENYKTHKLLPSFVESYGTFMKLIQYNNIFICPFFNFLQKKCSLYTLRPFDCRLYPFVIFYNKNYTEVNLGIDLQCLYAKNNDINILFSFAKELKRILEDEDLAETIYQNPGFIMDYNANFTPFFVLNKISRKIFGETKGLKLLSLSDKKIFDNFFRENEKNFSYNFEYLYSWKDIAYLLWTIVDDNLLVFWKHKEDCFLILPPLGKTLSARTIEFLRQFVGRKVSIDNIVDKSLILSSNNHFKLKSIYSEYIYERAKIVGLKGNVLKSQRWAYNYFKKKYLSKVRKLTSKDIEQCLNLYELWAEERLKKHKSRYYHLLIEDNFFAQRRLLLDYDLLELDGIALEIEGKIKGYSFGYPLDKDNFCIFAEVADLKFKGIAQYMFCEFCRKLENYRFINTMDDSALENVRKTKLSYRPVKLKKFYSGQLLLNR
ncbi:MAG: phosphatidylglycerol lysyltransferase domain-containing protein [Candidatus Omnitrophota bacterium]